MELSPYLHGASPAALLVEDLAWGPSRRAPIVQDIGFSVSAGEMLAIVGPNGAGKSSLLRCLYRFHRPLAGRISLDGADIWRMPLRNVARRVATVLQEPAGDFGLTVAEVVELGLAPHVGKADRRETRLAIGAALDLLNLADLAHRSFTSLSGGEKQRVLIAKALVQKPDLLILDEPTNHLDIRHQLEVLALLSALPTTVIVSLHDLALASAHADRVLVLRDGRQVDCGPAAGVLTPDAIRETFSVETVIDRNPATGRPRFSFHLETHVQGSI
ncbi:ABC transporter ATP-binding protein [Rhizobium cremeum]|uniref:ABC transporter ATP-binding protein n=1 Tax=Rhizobium cremeum TaxID=2813827 RepID=UPI001FD1FBA6|nr:ABC transporter ATP-binding protein [Rhizobium cremeum]MCJ7996140.1 ABC transporter ATP-binding protein [Rhizobium cremeum]MCJ8001399.1 ABC transporter ATP-binding protein [Rhizobium cremeum]